jgi:hypothetical protein
MHIFNGSSLPVTVTLHPLALSALGPKLTYSTHTPTSPPPPPPSLGDFMPPSSPVSAPTSPTLLSPSRQPTATYAQNMISPLIRSTIPCGLLAYWVSCMTTPTVTPMVRSPSYARAVTSQ